MENRKGAPGSSSKLPLDYLKLVAEVFNTNFDEGLQALKKLTGSKTWCQASGAIFPQEIVLCISVLQEGKLGATSVYASCDFDPQASSPSLEDLLNTCVDAIGTLFSQLLDPANPEQLARIAEESLSALENVPFLWTQVETNKRKIYLKVDKANPDLDQAADEWLAKNDPQYKEREEREKKETEELFFTGPKSKADSH